MFNKRMFTFLVFFICSCSNTNINDKSIVIHNDRDSLSNEIKLECRFYLKSNIFSATYAYINTDYKTLDQINVCISPCYYESYGHPNFYTTGYYLDRDFKKKLIFSELLAGSYDEFKKEDSIPVFISMDYEYDYFKKEGCDYINGHYKGFELSDINLVNNYYDFTNDKLVIENKKGILTLANEITCTFDIVDSGSNPSNFCYTFQNITINGKPFTKEENDYIFYGIEVKGKNIDGSTNIVLDLPDIVYTEYGFNSVAFTNCE